MRFVSVAVALLLVLGVAAGVRAEEQESLAMMPLTTNKLNKNVLKALDSLLIVAIDDLGPYKVISLARRRGSAHD